MTRNYIGLACTFHDPALAVVDSRGEVIFAEATERHLQSKRAFHCPPDGLSHVGRILANRCEPGADLVVAKSWSDGVLRRLALAEVLWKLFSPVLRRDHRAAADAFVRTLLVSLRQSVSLASQGLRLHVAGSARFDSAAPKITLRGYDHHLTHAAAGCFTSPFDEAVCAVVDGYGEGSSTAFYHYEGGALRPLQPGRRSFNSLGFFYMALCAACGFDPAAGEEWKVMGLAAYGKLDDRVYRRLRPALRVEGLRILGAARQYGNPVWRARLGSPPEDLAFTGQRVFEECMTDLLGNLHRLGLSDNLVLAGGCALNSTCNGRLLGKTPFRRLHVFSAPADDGNALGAALLAYRQDHPDWRPAKRIQSPYLGETLDPEAVARVVGSGAFARVSHHPGTIHEEAARLLAGGRILGWIQGRAEFGPRALGNRSILADPRCVGVKDRLNAQIKRREPFRPFAPAILHEHGPEYFEDYQESPYMERTLRFRPEAVRRVPAVVHVDETGRLQTVRKEWNESFHRLLEAFHRLSSVPVLLNTSFNVMGKPIVHSVEDAVAVFSTTGLDALVLGDYLLEKPLQ